MSDVTKYNPDDFSGFRSFVDEGAARSYIQGDLLRYTKHGDWKAGQDKETMEEGTRMLAFLPGFTYGWVKWHDNQPVKHVVGLLKDHFEKPDRESLGDMDRALWGELAGKKIDPWQETGYLVMLDEEGQLYTFSAGSKGGIGCLRDLVRTYLDHVVMAPQEIPIVELRSRSYPHRLYGETFAPVLEITGWAAIPQNFKDLSGALGPSRSSGNGGNGSQFVLPPQPTKAAPAEPPPARPRPVPAASTQASAPTTPTRNAAESSKPRKPVKF